MTTTLANLNAVSITYHPDVAGSYTQWRLWIPPTEPEHRDAAGSDIGAWGETWHNDLAAVIRYLVQLTQDGTLTADWVPTYLPPENP